MKLKQITLLMALCSSLVCYAQQEVAKVVKLEEFVVSAGLEGFDVDDFVYKVVNDTTFYQAFLNMKYFPHDIESELLVYFKDESEQGRLIRKARQYKNESSEAWVDIQSESQTGKLRKRNGEWRFLTAEMYDDVFFPTEKHRVSRHMVEREQELVGGSSLEKHKAQLKKMLFNPGQEIENVPFIGDKMAIFSKEMVPFYDYSIFARNWADSVPCIVFSAYAKPGMEDETVIHDMTSYFHRETGEVIAREYRLAHQTIFFDFDISIKVINGLIKGEIVPLEIYYDGQWDIPFKKPEILRFQIYCDAYEF